MTDVQWSAFVVYFSLFSATACTKTQAISSDEYLRALQGEEVRGKRIGPEDEVKVVLKNGRTLFDRQHSQFCIGDPGDLLLADCSDPRRARPLVLLKNIAVVEITRPDKAANVGWAVGLTAYAAASIAAGVAVSNIHWF